MPTPTPSIYKDTATLAEKARATLRPLYDARVWLLLGLCALAGWATDPAGLAAFLGLCLWQCGVWAVALCITKLIMPYVSLAQLYTRACLGSTAAAIVFAARVALLVAVGISLVVWGR